ncbi:hypothetical protein (N-terminal fragment), partial [Sporisorium reilianum SRZ2]
MYSKARKVMTGAAASKVFKDVGIDAVLCRETVLRRMPTWLWETTPPPTVLQPEDTPTPTTSEEAKRLMALLFASQRQQAEQQAHSERKQCMLARKLEKVVDRLFNQQ